MQTCQNLLILLSNYFYLGDIMKEKLSNAEIEERKKQNILETAKINSCISGIPLSDIIQSGIQSGNYGDKDCMVKQQFLKNLVEPVTSRELYETLKRQNYTGNYNTFRGLLFRYQKYGYVKKSNDKKPFMYQLTDKGYQHAKNPYLSRELMARNYLEHLYRNIEKELVDHPEALKALLESITQMNMGSPIGSGVTVSNSGSQYSQNDIGSELQHDLEYQIFTPDFFKNADEQKLKALVDGILDNSLSDDQKKELIFDALREAINSNKGSMIIQKQYNPSKPVGLRNYYEYLINGTNNVVTRSTYEAIPFRFIYIQNKRELRLESESIAGKYRNNEDATVLDFDYLNRNFFGNNMIIRSERQGDEMVFYYARMNGKIIAYQKEITTMSVTDYNKVKKIKPSTLKFAKTN